MLSNLTNQICTQLLKQSENIAPERKLLLDRLAQYIQSTIEQQKNIKLNFICTHNSRRSHLGQVWAKTAAIHIGIPNVETYSGGTEATAFNPNAIQALQTDGFDIVTDNPTDRNPFYKVTSGTEWIADCFSKTFNDKHNPKSDFAAIMTCSDAESNCPHVPGASFRIGITYDDPKSSDNTTDTELVYLERSRQIATEMLYVFHRVSQLCS